MTLGIWSKAWTRRRLWFGQRVIVRKFAGQEQTAVGRMGGMEIIGVKVGGEGPAWLADSPNLEEVSVLIYNQGGYDNTELPVLPFLRWLKANRPDLLEAVTK